MLLRHAAVNATLGCVLLVACGGAPARPAAPAPSASDGTKGAGQPKPAANAQAIAERQTEFMTQCSEPMVKSPGYCECAWGEYRKGFSDSEIADGTPPPEEKVDTVKQQIFAACSSKISEETAKAGWDESCIGEKKELKPFCDCSWTEFRKHLSAAELGNEDAAQSDRFVAARAPVAKACSSKMPEAFAKETFMSGCVDDPQSEKFCQCGWKALRTVASAAEITFDAVDQQTVEATLNKMCSKLRPKQ